VTGRDEGTLPAVTPYLVAHIGRHLQDLASREDCPYRQDIADAANALLGLEPDPGSPWDGRPLGEPDTAPRGDYPALSMSRDDWGVIVNALLDHQVACGTQARAQRCAYLSERIGNLLSGGAGEAPSMDPPAEPDTALRERIEDALAETDALAKPATVRGNVDAVMGVLSAAPPEREAPSREEAIHVVARGLSDDLRRAHSGGVDVDMRPATIVDALIERGWLCVRKGEVQRDGE
jgi:hypothetical protein